MLFSVKIVKSRLELASAKVEVEVEAELGNNQFGLVWFTLSITTYPCGWVSGWVGCVSIYIKANSAKVEVEVEVELGNSIV